MAQIPEELKNRLKNCRSLPSIPAVAIKIIELCERDDIGTPEVARVLAHDPALAAKVLKVANSAIYGVRTQVTALDRAIAIMGINAVLSLSLSFSLVQTLRRSGRAGFDHCTYWRRSIITAAASKALGASAGLAYRDEFFLAGLLQDIGMLALNEALPETYGRLIPLAKRNHCKLIELERKALGTDHGIVGGALLESWDLPAILRRSTAISHAAETTDHPEMDKFCKIVVLAGHIAEIWTNPDTGSATAFARQKAFELLEMTPIRFEILLGEIAGALPQITANLELEIGSQEALNRLYDQARDALIALTLQAQHQARLLQDLAKHDGLTALYNRGHLEESLPQIYAAAIRMHQPLSALFVDVDNFKTINDTYGHQAGDSVLMSVGQILRSATRASDLVARYGGDEFVCLLPNTSSAGARLVAQRIRAAACQPHKVAGGIELNVTLSQGCATSVPDHPYESGISLLQEADHCLYSAKNNGRNRVMDTDSSGAGSNPYDSEAVTCQDSVATDRSCPDTKTA